MDVVLWVVMAAAVAWLTKTLMDLIVNKSKFPPGPWGLPLVGYMPWIGEKPHLTFIRLGKKYGGIFSVNIAGDVMVVLNDWASVKATLGDQSNVFNGRPDRFIFKSFSRQKDVAFSDGPVWKAQRNLTVQCLKDIGMSKTTVVDMVYDLVADMVKRFNMGDRNKDVVSIATVMFEAVLDFNWRFVAGHESASTDEALRNVNEDFRLVFGALRITNPLFIFPWLRFVPPNGFGYWKIKRSNDNAWNHFKVIVDEHVKRWKSGSENDFVDQYITNIKKLQTDDSKPPYNVDHMMGSMWDLFFAGVETISTTFSWGFLFLAHNQSVQRKVHDELDKVVGRHRLPTLQDVSDMPYLCAVIMEIHRVGSVVPFSIPHVTSAEVQVAGYKIPKGTTCIPHAYAIHNDPNLWEEPEKFQPERFLDKNGKAVAPPFLIPFSLGSRLCVGKPLADVQLKLVFSCLLQKFHFFLPPNLPEPTLEPFITSTHQPHKYSLLVQKRAT